MESAIMLTIDRVKDVLYKANHHKATIKIAGQIHRNTLPNICKNLNTFLFSLRKFPRKFNPIPAAAGKMQATNVIKILFIKPFVKTQRIPVSIMNAIRAKVKAIFRILFFRLTFSKFAIRG